MTNATSPFYLVESTVGNTLYVQLWVSSGYTVDTINYNLSYNNVSLTYVSTVAQPSSSTTEPPVASGNWQSPSVLRTANGTTTTIAAGTFDNNYDVSGNALSYVTGPGLITTTTFTFAAGSTATFSGSLTVTDYADSYDTDQGAAPTVNYSYTACFASGTRIVTPTGEQRVESLAVGDLVMLADGGVAPVKWLGHRTINCTTHSRPETVWPVLVRANALGEGLPHADLWLSRDHAVFVSGLLVPIRLLVNGVTIAQMPRDQVTYWHVELDRHNIILAEGMPSESYLESGNRGAFENGGEVVQLHPDFGRRIYAENACAPLAESGAALEALRARLLDQLRTSGVGETNEPDMHIVADGIRVDADEVGTFTIPAQSRRVVLKSRSGVMAEHDAASFDTRRLGVSLAGIDINGQRIRFDDARLVEGFNTAEADCRWTNGAAVLPATLWAGAAGDVRISPVVKASMVSWMSVQPKLELDGLLLAV